MIAKKLSNDLKVRMLILYKPVRRHFPHRTYDVRNPFDVWEGDLADLRSLKT